MKGYEEMDKTELLMRINELTDEEIEQIGKIGNDIFSSNKDNDLKELNALLGFKYIFDWEWYKDANTKSVFFHLLFKANTKDKLWKGYCIEKGQCISSYSNLSSELGLTVAQIRRAVENLKSTNEISHQNCGKYGLFTIINYNHYSRVREDV